MNTDNILKELDKVPLSKVEAAIEHIKKCQPYKNPDNIFIPFEFLIGSFYPDILNNVKNAIKDAYTKGFIEGSQQNSHS